MKRDNKVRVAFYMRVSTIEQVEGFSLEMQENALKEHVERNGYKGWYTNAKWHFTEQGSGGDMDRGQLKKLLEMAKKGEFDLVLVWKIDRISRSLSDLLEIFEILDKNGVGFASFKEDIDFTGAIGKLIFQIFGALAEFERESIKMRTTEGKKTSALHGNYIGGSIPYGYEKLKNPIGKGSKLKIINREAAIVNQIFNWFAYDKKNPTEIAKELNKMAIPKGKSSRSTIKQTKWVDTTIRVILMNETYRGSYIANRYKIISKKPKRSIERPREEWIISEAPAIVNDITFYGAQDQLRKGSRNQRGGGNEVYMLAGKLIDMNTGKGFVGYKSYKKTKNYRRKKFIDKNGEIHKTISIAEKDLASFVWSHIETAINKPEVFLKIHEENTDNNKKAKSLAAKRITYEKAYSAANEKLGRVDDDFYEGNINSEKRDILKSKYTEERDYNFSKMREIEQELKTLSFYVSACRDLEKFSANMKEGISELNYEQKANLINMLVEKAEIYEDTNKRRVKVYFRFEPKAIANTIPLGRTDLAQAKAKNTQKEGDNLYGGGR